MNGRSPDDMSNRVAVPSFGQHSDTDDAAHVASRRMEGAFQFLGQFLESFG